jgi:PmbA protein
VRRLNPRKIESCRVPVIYDPRVSKNLLGSLAGAISGAAVARGTSFLKDRMDQPVFAESITIIDDPLMPRGLHSRPFDGEGTPTGRRTIVDRGRLATWLLDLRSARQLGLATTGHASRGTSGPPSPSPSNLYLLPGTRTPAELIADVADGFYVTDLMGMGVNGITGDYSQGAAGFRIENGVLSYPVSEVTIASNLKEMFRSLTAADDLQHRYGIDAPTLRVDGMTLAGL